MKEPPALMTPTKCHAHKSHGRGPCNAWAIPGGTVCLAHGGRAPQTRAKARARLDALAEPALVALGKIIRSDDTADADKLKAISEVLDRIPGFGRTKTVNIDATVAQEWSDPNEAARLFAEVVEQERARLRGQASPTPQIVEYAEVVEDDD